MNLEAVAHVQLMPDVSLSPREAPFTTIDLAQIWVTTRFLACRKQRMTCKAMRCLKRMQRRS